jgi:DNA-binding MarR family transcriptional regulator
LRGHQAGGGTDTQSTPCVNSHESQDILCQLLADRNKLEESFGISALKPRAHKVLYIIFMETRKRAKVTVQDLGGARYNLGARPALKRNLMTLVRSSLITMQASVTDARKNEVQLTEKGRAFFEMLSRAAVDIYSAHLDGTSKPRVK